MKWSKYNYMFQSGDKYFLYNSLSNSLAELENHEFYMLKSKNDSISDLNSSNSELFNSLRQMKAIVENDKDEINKIKYINSLRRVDNRRLILTINPTLACNFNCSYCFEKQHPSIFMSDSIEEKIINFIKRNKDAKALDITWFGGEPLLAFDRIESLTNKFQSLNLKYKAHIITNGYLLTSDACSRLDNLAITSVQITIDGLESTHNSRRYLKSGAPTFSKIIDNIDTLKQINPAIEVTVRVNVDRNNKDDFIKLYKMFNSKQYKNFSISLAFVQNLSGDVRCENIMERTEQSDFVMNLYQSYGLDFSFIYPRHERYECAIRNKNSLVIGPEGELYKCWNDVGDVTKIVGNIDGAIENQDLLLRYLVGADPFEDPKCKSCILLPVCGGGCPYLRIKNEFEGKDVNSCPLIKDNLNEFLFAHALFKTLSK